MMVLALLTGSAASEVDLEPSQVDFPEAGESAKLQQSGSAFAASASDQMTAFVSELRSKDLSRLPENERRLVEHLLRLADRAQAGDPDAAELLRMGERLLNMAEQDPQKAAQIYDLLEKMANGELRYEDLSQQQRQLLDEVGINRPEDIERLGIDNIFKTAQAMAGAVVHPERM